METNMNCHCLLREIFLVGSLFFNKIQLNLASMRNLQLHNNYLKI